MNTIRITRIADGRLACVIKGPSKRILLQGFVYTTADVDRLKPMFTHYLGLRRGNLAMARAKLKLSAEFTEYCNWMNRVLELDSLTFLTYDQQNELGQLMDNCNTFAAKHNITDEEI